MLNALTIDVEDWFCVEAFSTQFPIETWDNQKTRILSNIVRTLEILDDYEVKATFFVLGWIADRFPEIVDHLHNNGHEIGSHSYAHKLVFNMTPEEFRKDTILSLEAIGKAGDIPVIGYRAPSFSIKPEQTWVWEILAECGFKYDSSVFPVTHDIYGSPNAPRFANKINVNDNHTILEIPPSTIRLFGRNFGFGGGGYLRMFPYWFTDWGIKKVNRMGFPAIIYFHPWEIDYHQPRQKVGFKSLVRHYTNLRTTEIKLRKLLGKYKFAPMSKVFDFEIRKKGNKEI